jgi:endonuclease/exonuclease/phosphatase family metal-dependent hydrolase
VNEGNEEMNPCRHLFRILRYLLFNLVVLGAARAETLTIATYNIENYGAADRMTEDGYRKDYPKPELEKRALRRVIQALDADVLVLQEMGPQPYFEEFRRDLKSEGIDYLHAVLLEGADADRHVAILSRRAFKSVIQYRELEISYFGKKEKVKRGLLEVVLATDAGDLTIFAVHLKSRFTDRPDDPESGIRRLSEATAVRDGILKRFPNPQAARFVIVGDCNDTKGSKPLDRLTARGKTTISEILPVADSHGETWTHTFRKEESYSRVDYLLVSPGLRTAVEGNAARIYDGEGVSEASDHRPVVARFRLEKP